MTAEHVVNAGGLWARRVGRMVGVDHPLTPMLHHYLVTEAIPEVAAIEGDMPAVTDLEGFTYLQREGDGVLLGLYEQNPAHWKIEGADWDFGMELFPEDLDRIMPELSIGFDAVPGAEGRRDQAMGERRVHVHAGRQPARRVRSTASRTTGPRAACMSGFSQGAGIGLALANWIVDGDPGYDVFGMDVARFGLVRERRRVPARDDPTVLRATVRDGVPERGAPGGASAPRRRRATSASSPTARCSP